MHIQVLRRPGIDMNQTTTGLLDRQHQRGLHGIAANPLKTKPGSHGLHAQIALFLILNAAPCPVILQPGVLYSPESHTAQPDSGDYQPCPVSARCSQRIHPAVSPLAVLRAMRICRARYSIHSYAWRV